MSKSAFIKIGISILIFLYILACGKKKQEEYQVPITSNLSGKELAQKHCASCHLYPEPSQYFKII
jgi:hypothetical protein